MAAYPMHPPPSSPPSSPPSGAWLGLSRLQWALLLSLVLHAVMVGIKFVTPKPIQAPPSALEVIVVNRQSERAPQQADALAQVALDGGGEHEQGRATSPLPDSGRREAGEAMVEQRRAASGAQGKQGTGDDRLDRMKQLEKLQKELQRQAQQHADQAVAEMTEKARQSGTSGEAQRGEDLLADARAIARMEAQVSRSIEDYNKRPRKHFFSPSTSPYSYALYEDAWRQKVERFGNLNYPEEAKGKFYGQLRLTVYIRADGTLEDIELDKSSGQPVLDRAAMRIVRLAAPFARFPPEMAKQVDVLAITRTWIFTNDALETRGGK